MQQAMHTINTVQNTIKEWTSDWIVDFGVLMVLVMGAINILALFY